LNEKPFNRSTLSGGNDSLKSRICYHLTSAGAGVLRLNRRKISAETSHETSDSMLKLAVLGGVDERIDTAVGVHQDTGQVVGPASDIHLPNSSV